MAFKQSCALKEEKHRTEGRVKSNPVTVMIVHDEAYVSYALSGFLRLHGFDVVAVGHDLRVIEQINPSSKPDNCILGELPLCTPKLIDGLRERYPRTRVALFAAAAFDPIEAKAEIDRAHDIGFDVTLPAFFNDRKIVSSIRGALREKDGQTDGCTIHSLKGREEVN